jgi:hypothetical protein
MKSKGTSRRRVKIVRERPSKEVLDAINELQEEVGLLTDAMDKRIEAETRAEDAFGNLTAYADLIARRLDGLEAKLAAEKMREAVKW